jgi:hypothetical protein
MTDQQLFLLATGIAICFLGAVVVQIVVPLVRYWWDRKRNDRLTASDSKKDSSDEDPPIVADGVHVDDQRVGGSPAELT